VPERFLPYGHQTVDFDDIEAVVRVLKSDYLTTGPEVAAFEADLAAVSGASCAAVLNSCTSALHAAYAAIGVGPGDEIVTSPMTFAATGNAALYLGARPVFVDIDPSTGLIDPELVEGAITSHTRAIVAIDYAGQPADYDALRRIADGHNLKLVADAAHSLGATDSGRPVGTLADVTALSFHPVKLITTGEGGAVLTDDADVHSRVMQFRSHGMVYQPSRLSRDEGPWYMEMQSLGFNYRMTDIQCALGRSQLQKLPRFLARRRAIADWYDRDLSAVAGLDLPGRRQGADSAWHLYVVRVSDPSRRRPFFEALRRREIGVQVHYIPVYRHPYYRDLGYAEGLCPRAEEFYARAVSLPIFPGLTDRDVARVIETISAVAREVLA
jgi:UDP-4-amino-4,6-dideoxy-N-acetyl-beta-L-altrosamine transaminase